MFWEPSIEHLCLEAGDKFVRTEERVETARGAVDKLVFSKTRRLQFA